jgi:hypothetical protein
MKCWRSAVTLITTLVLAAAVPAAGGTEITANVPAIGGQFFTVDSGQWKTAWGKDPKTGAQIGYVIKVADTELVDVGWQGPVVGGKAHGQGVLRITLKRNFEKAQLIQSVMEGNAEMAGGLLEGTANLKTAWTNTILSTGEKLSGAWTYDGSFKAGLEEGQGKMAVDGKPLFEGQWKRGQEYRGFMIKTKGRITYEGEIQDGTANGSGKATFRNQGAYTGQFKNGKYEGEGTFRYATLRGQGGMARPGEVVGGASFQGAFSNDAPNGHGVFKDGRGQVIYEGEWKDGKPLSQ